MPGQNAQIRFKRPAGLVNVKIVLAVLCSTLFTAQQLLPCCSGQSLRRSPPFVVDNGAGKNFRSSASRPFTLESVYNISEDAPVGQIIATMAFYRDKPGDLDETNYTFRIAHDSDLNRQFSIEPKYGRISVAKPLDREAQDIHRLKIEVTDRVAGSIAQQSITVNLMDVNDNAPYLNDSHLIIWEDEPPGFIGIVTAYDPDGPGNGPPFFMNQTQDSPYLDLIYTQFDNKCCTYENGFLNISSLKTVDREGNRDKVLEVPILTRDSGNPQQEAIRHLRIVIGDKNDNPMRNGLSTIHVYNYKGQMPTTSIGRVFVDDLDDWDVVDKDFKLKTSTSYFQVSNDGMITMSQEIPLGTHTLEVRVYDRVRKESAIGTVKVVVDYLDEEAIDNIGSVRIRGISAENFLRPAPKGDTSPYDGFRSQLAYQLGLDESNVKIFSIMPMPGNIMPPYVEIFFAVSRPGPNALQYGPAHSAYVASPLLTGIIERHKSAFESALQISKSSIVLVNIDPCVNEQCTDGGCTRLITPITDRPIVIMANKTSLVGVNLNVSSLCQCPKSVVARQCTRNSCFNGGICHNTATGFFCECRNGIVNGSRCESRTRNFTDQGFVWLKPIGSCDNITLSLEFMTKSPNGILLYNGPMTARRPFDNSVPDLLALQIKNGLLEVKVNLGTLSTWFSLNSTVVNDGEWHVVDIVASRLRYEMTLDRCRHVKTNNIVSHMGFVGQQEFKQLVSSCKVFVTASGSNEQLNVDDPLQLGGVAPVDSAPFDSGLTRDSFAGCIRNLRINGELFDLGDQGVFYAESSHVGCFSSPPLCQWVDESGHVDRKPVPYCLRGECLASMSGLRRCICEPGWHGPRCDQESKWKTFSQSSYAQYAFYDDGLLSPLHSSLKILVVPQHTDNGDVAMVRGTTFKQFMKIGFLNNRAEYSFSFDDPSTSLYRLSAPVPLPTAASNVSYWLDVERYGHYSRITVDGLSSQPYSTYRIGEMEEPFFMQYDTQGFLLGAGSVPPRPENDFVGCIKEFYIDDAFVPVGESNDVARIVSQNNVHNSCSIFPTCSSSGQLSCPPPLICVDFWKGPFCTCPHNMVPLLTGDGTLHTCGGHAEALHVGITRGAVAAILISLLALIILVLLLIVYSKRNRKLPPSDDHLIGNVCDYKEEGGGEADQGKYDIVALRKPIYPSNVLLDNHLRGAAANGSHVGSPKKVPLDASIRMSNLPGGKSDADLDAFLQDRLGKMDDDFDGICDEIRPYAVEADGVSLISLSSLSSSASDHSDIDDDRLDNWGPKFKLLADAFRYDKSQKLD